LIGHRKRERKREGRGGGEGGVEGRERGGRLGEEEKGDMTEGGKRKEENERGAAVIFNSLNEQWCKSFWPEFFASNSSFGSYWAPRNTALNKFEILKS
jgi:hypothetical protein